MKIIETFLKFVGSLLNIGVVNKITLHHAEWSNCTVDDIHQSHLNRGWSGIGYHFFVRKDGTIYRGRPEDKLGAHTSNNNSNNLGICFEGSYMKETMPETQINAGIELINYLCNKYGLKKSDVYKHKDLSPSDCPGTNFPFSSIVNGQATVTPPTPPTNPAPEADEMFESAKKYNSPNCKPIQLLLIANGYNLPNYGADNKYGNETHEQIGKFQLDHGLNVDYKVGPNTIRELAIILKVGSQGDLVRWLQAKVGASTDGDFGSKTQAKVIEFQKANGLIQDGIVGANTFIKLLNM